MYQKFQATQLFTGTELLQDQLVLITKQDGTVEGIVGLEDAGDDIQSFEGVLSPGFINAHCHLELSHMKGMIPTETGLGEFVKQIVGLRKVPEAQIQEAIVNAEAEMIANGIVAVGDISNTTDTLAQKEKNNLAYYNFVEIYDLDPTLAPDKMIAGLAVQKQFTDSGLTASLIPHAPYSVTFALWKLLAKHFGTHTITMHNQETPAENEFFETKTGSFLSMYERTKISLDFFHATGLSSLQSVLPFFKNASTSILVHNSFTTAADINAIDKEMPNTFWCLCPNANQYIEKTMPPIELLQKHSAKIIVGTDSLASNWSLNILDELKTIQKYNPSIPLAEMLTWATLNGALALQMDKRLGSFETGKKPGVVLIEGVNEYGSLTAHTSSRRII
jgi:cytosine/adenosine deaminase-related metal-dependent hydrolase